MSWPARLRQRAVLAPAGHAAVDQPRVARRQHLGAEAEPLHHAGPKALDQHVGALDQAQRHVARRAAASGRARSIRGRATARRCAARSARHALAVPARLPADRCGSRRRPVGQHHPGERRRAECRRTRRPSGATGGRRVPSQAHAARLLAFGAMAAEERLVQLDAEADAFVRVGQAAFEARDVQRDVGARLDVLAFHRAVDQQRADRFVQALRRPFVAGPQVGRRAVLEARADHAAAVHRQAGEARQGQPALRLEQAAGLLQLEEQPVGGAPVDDLLQVMQLLRRLVGVDRRADLRAQAGHAFDVPVRQRLLDQVEPARVELADDVQRLLVVPEAVGVDRQEGVGADRVAHRVDHRDVVGHRAVADLHLEEREAGLLRERGLGGDVVGLAGRQHPALARRFECAAAEQLVDRHAEQLALEVVQREVDRRLGLVVVAHQQVHLRRRSSRCSAGPRRAGCAARSRCRSSR